MPFSASASYIYVTAKSYLFVCFLIMGLWVCHAPAFGQTLTAGSVSGTISTCVGTASSAPNLLSFTIAATNLTGPIRIVAPADLEINSTQPESYSGVITINANGTSYNGTIYVRTSARAGVGTKSGDVVLSTPGAADVRVPVSATVNALPVVNPVFNQALVAGKNTLPILFTGSAEAYSWTNDQPEIGLAANGRGNIAAFTAVNKTRAPITATITVTPKRADLLYITNAESSSVTVVDMATNAVVETKTIGVRPLTPIVSGDGKQVYISYMNEGAIDVMNVPANSITDKITANTIQREMQITPDGKKMYVIQSNNYIIVADLADLTKTKQIGTDIAHMKLSPDGKHLFVSCYTDRSLISYNTATDLEEYRIPLDYVGSLVCSPDGNRVYMSSWNGEFLAINTVAKAIEFQTTVGGSDALMAITPDGSRVYSANEQTGKMSVFNTLSNAIVASIPTGVIITKNATPAAGVVVSPDGKYVYVRRSYGQILKISTADNSIVNTIIFQADMSVSAFSADGSRLYLAGEGLNPMVHVVDVATDLEITRIQARLGPYLDSRSFRPGTGCIGDPIIFKITVAPPPSTVTVTAATGNIQACIGTVSSGKNLQQFTVTGKDLNGVIKATAPSGFEVSLSNDKDFSSFINIPQVNSATNAIVYVRATPTPNTGSSSGDVTLSTGGAADITVRVTATINALPIVDKVNDQKVVAGNNITPTNFTGTGEDYVWTNDHPEIGLTANGSGNIAAFTAVNKTGAPITATITVTPKPADYLYVANYMDGTADIVNMNTNDVTRVGVGGHPQRTLVSRDGKYVFVSSWDNGTVNVIDPVNKRSIKNIPVRANPQAMVLSHDGSRLYVTSQTTKDIAVIDVPTLTVEKYIPVGVITNEAILSPDGKYLYAGMSWTHAKTIALNIVTEQVDATLDVSLDEKAQFSADGKNLFSTDQNMYLYLISNVGVPSAKTINVTVGAMRIGVTADGKFVYVTHEALKYISVYSAATGTLFSSIPSGTNNLDIAPSPDGKYMYVVSFSNVLMIETATHTVQKTFTFRGEGGAVAVSPDGARVYIAERQRAEVHAIDVATGAISNIPSNILSHFSNNSFRMGMGCVGQPVSFKITVDPPPTTLTASPISGGITACSGTPSSGSDIVQFTATGKDLTGGITAVASAGFEVSLSRDKDFSNSVSIPRVNGDATAAVYVRTSTTAPLGNILGNVVLSTGGSTDVKVAVSALINPLPVVNPVADQKLTAGDMTSAVKFTGDASLYTWTNDKPSIGLAAAGSGDIASFKTINTTGATITANVTVTPKPAANIYVLEDLNKNLDIISTATKSRVANIPVGGLGSRMVLSKDRKHIYVSEVNDNRVVLIDAVGNKLIRTFTGINEAMAVWVLPDESKMYVSNRSGTLVTAIDLVTGNQINTMPVNIDQNARAVMSPDANRWYLRGLDNITVINTNTDLVEKVIPVAGRFGSYILISPDGGRLYVFDGNNGLVVVDAKTYNIIKTITVAGELSTLYMSPDGSRIYVSSGYGAHLYVIDTQSNTVVGDINIGSEVSYAVISPDGKRIYITSFYHQHLTILNTVDNSTERVPLSAERALSPFLSNDGTLLYISGGNGLLIVDLVSKKEINGIATYGANEKAMGAELGCIGDPFTFKITVDPPPATITFAGNLSVMKTTYGTASPATSIAVSGVSLTEGILVTPPAGFEVSADNVTFGKAVKVGAAGNAGPLNVYIRLAATTYVGNNYTGDLMLSSANAKDVKVTVPSSIVGRATLTIEGIFTKVYGDRTADFTAVYNAPDITFTVTGLKNGETFKAIDVSYGSFAAPATAVNTYNTAVTLSNFAGDNGFLASNYQPDYKLSTLKVTPATLTITANNVDKYYGDVLTAVTGSAAFSTAGIKNSEKVGTVDITYGAGSAVADPVNTYVGSVKPVNAKGGTFNPNNYTINYTAGNINVRTAPRAVINVITRPAGVNAIYGDASAASSFNITATYLLGPITVTPPAGFEVSADGKTFGSITTVGGIGSLPSTMVYIRLSGKADVNSYSGAINLNAGVAFANVNMPKSAVSKRVLTLKALDDRRTYGTALANYVGALRYSMVTGSLQNGNTISTVTVNYQTGNAVNSPVNKYTGSATVGPVTGGNGYLPGNYSIVPQAGDVYIDKAALVIRANKVTKNYGEALSGGAGSTAFTADLQNGETIGSITTTYGPGAAATEKAGTYASSVKPSAPSGGTFNINNYTVSYENGTIEVAKLPLTVRADNKTRAAGAANPPLTFSYSGFLGTEDEAQLTAKPIAVTTAAVWSQPGKYAITLAGGAADNYIFVYIDGELTIEKLKLFNPATLGFPNAFTPNNDNINDTWNLPALQAYPNSMVSIFDRYGRAMFSSLGYGKPWDGKFNGADLPTATYYYVVDLKNGEKPVSGSVTLIR